MVVDHRPVLVMGWPWLWQWFCNGNECCANGLPAQLNNDYGRELLMQAIQGNRALSIGSLTP